MYIALKSFAMCGRFSVILTSDMFVNPEGKILEKGHFFDLSNKYKLIVHKLCSENNKQQQQTLFVPIHHTIILKNIYIYINENIEEY